MTEQTFRPNWASAPGETIQAIIRARGFSKATLGTSLAMHDTELNGLLVGKLEISSDLAKRLADVLGSTPRFWLERDKQYHESLKTLELAAPELLRWARSFPVSEMVKAGWLNKPAPNETVGELLAFFGVSDLEDWRENYRARLTQTKFRTSESFENAIGSTTAWIRRGEIVAEEMNCGPFHKEDFGKSLSKLKTLTLEENPRVFIPALQQECAKHGVAVVVTRCVAGCAASGATHLLDNGTALLLLSARFLSDDQFWFSFFHEAGHLMLHTNEACVEENGAETTTIEEEANTFAQRVILDPVGEDQLSALATNKFSIARFARRCNVSAGVIVGQLQHKKRIRHSAYNPMKVRYTTKDFSL
jgi:HTH-type transcriptional regulator / antitoxin HigA